MSTDYIVSKYLYTMSSNATEKYTVNILEALASPRGFVHHFRYELRWLDQELRDMLNLKEGSLSDRLKDIKVVTCYLYQLEKVDTWEWISVYPIRMGTLVDAYKTGNNDRDVAHFFIKVDNYVSYNSHSFNETIQNMLGEKYGRCYASLGFPLDDRYVANNEESRQAFHKICNSLEIKHFQSPKGEKYYPIFSYLDGLKDEKGAFLDPIYDALSYKTYYKIKEGSRYTFEFSIYFPELPPEFTVSLKSDEKVFPTPGDYKLKVSSRYDEESWLLVSRLLESNIWTSISFQSNLDIVDKRPLNLLLTFPVWIERKMRYRIIEICGDVGFGIGTGSILLSKALEDWTWWYWPVGIGYFVWLISKLIIKFWKG